jgi:4-amino-4-deoxy-L-arabinose transferase-like glycosyltransferase
LRLIPRFTLPPVLVGALLLLVTGHLWPAAFVSLAGLVATALATRVRFESFPSLAARLFLVGFVVRVLLGVATWLGAPLFGQSPGAWFPDGGAFDRTSVQLANYFQGLPYYIDYYYEGFLINLYSRSVAHLYVVFGYDSLIPISLNWILGAATGVAVYGAARQLAGQWAAFGAGLVVALFPSTILWSLFNLREALGIFLLSGSMWAVLVVVKRNSVTAMALGIAAFLILGKLRFYVGLPVMWMAMGTALVSLWMRPARAWLLRGAFIAAVALSPMVFGGGVFGIMWLAQEGADYEFAPPAVVEQAQTLQDISPEERLRAGLNARQELMTFYTEGGARTQFAEAPAVPCRAMSCLLDVIPLGVVHVLFSPFPWEVETLKDLAGLAEMPLWLLAYPTTIAGLVLRRGNWRLWLFPLGLTTGLMLILSIFDVNVGAIVRHRALLLPGFAILAAQGCEAIYESVRQRRIVRAEEPRLLTT